MWQVESFEDLQKDAGIAIHKPFYCSLHPGESVKFFCIGCQVTTILISVKSFIRLTRTTVLNYFKTTRNNHVSGCFKVI